MGLSFVLPQVIEGYGLREEDLNEIILMERLNDISKKFSRIIEKTQTRFNSEVKIRIIEFDELSGATLDSKLFFRRFIHGQRDIFYTHVHSNRDCCVIFCYGGYAKNPKLLSERILPHEFAHHYQLVSQRFPCFLPKGTPKELAPQFARYYEIGPKIGSVYIDSIFLDGKFISLIKDFSERIADFICEGILREKGFREGLSEEYSEIYGDHIDPEKDFPTLTNAGIQYLRRLSLRDIAEWHALLDLTYPDDQTLKKILAYDKKWIISLNKKFGRAKKAFNEIYNISLNIDFKSFKHIGNAVDYIKKITDLLAIMVRTKEKW